jgi:hypothetical protein
MRFLIQGKVLSKVECHLEREAQANRKGITLDSVPLKYGSVRIAVNLINLDDTAYMIDRKSSDLNIKEDRLILEISYKFDAEGNVAEEHDIINDLHIKDNIELIMEDAYVAKNHYLKLINVGESTTIKSYFLKSWANKIYFLNEVAHIPYEDSITPKAVLQKLNVNQELVIA